uniref:Uncharacterized protein n=1 Tax=Magallana gigas TaxID=29159 RepID=K1Q3C8_MAGGI
MTGPGQNKGLRVPIQFLAVHRRGNTCPPLSHAMPYLSTTLLHACDEDYGHQKT